MSTIPTVPKPPATGKPVVIGVYGIPGSGKTFLLKQLESRLQGSGHFAFYDSSRVISSIVPGGLEAFQQLSDCDKARYRQDAITHIGKDCATSGRTGIVAGHCMFWDEGKAEGTSVHTQGDLETYTHILYLEVPAPVVFDRRLTDKEKKRVSMSVEHLDRWQREEKAELRRLCMNHGILFSAMCRTEADLADEVSVLVQDFRLHSEELNLRCVATKLDQALEGKLGKLETVLIVDGDRTLAAEDTGTLFWNALARTHKFNIAEDPFKILFGSPMGYSHAAFRQAGLLYREAAPDGRFDEICDAVAAEVALYQQFRGLLALAAASERVHAVAVTCGLAPIWQRVLDRAGLGMVTVVGCEPVGTGGLTITPEVKGALVSHLQETHHCRVVAFGDSPLDLPMLSKADQAIVVVGEEDRRSKTMEAALLDAIDNHGLQAQQLLLPSSVSPRLDDTRLPSVELADPAFLHSVFLRRPRRTVSPAVHAAPSIAAKLLMTPTRNATVAGPALREAHRQIGRFLAVELVADLVGVEEYPIPHVQGHTTQGHRLAHEEETLIVALMRGGEPMAFGVNDAFPLAMFLHAKQPQDLMLHHVKDRKAVLLVDSVVNNGKTAVQFIQRVRDLDDNVRIVVVAGVVQSQAVTGDKPLARVLIDDDNLDIVALRLSDNQYTGRGSTDTGNRLFNTTLLE